MTNVLVVEDDLDISGLLTRCLQSEGFSVDVAARVEDALSAAREGAPEVVLLDVGLPDGSGHEVCRSLRKGGYSGAILFLSARAEIRDRAEGLALGADDYIVKPFDFDELLARLQTQITRRRGQHHRVLTAGRLKLHVHRREAHFEGAVVRLTVRETELLAFLMKTPNEPISRDTIFAAIWSSQGASSPKVVDNYTSYLRTKLQTFGALGGPTIKTIRDQGVMLELHGTFTRY